MNSLPQPCVGKATGRPVRRYTSREDAARAAFTAHAYGTPKMTPYACPKCLCWHLSPENRETPSEKCTYCRGSDGNLKATYRTQSEANKRSALLRGEHFVRLVCYPCPHGTGWHLTKQKN